MNRYFIYFATSGNRSTFYIGVTSNLERSISEHKSHAVEGFTKRYNCVNLVYFEEAASIYDAIAREKQLKKWNRSEKNTLVEGFTPTWMDLSVDW